MTVTSRQIPDYHWEEHRGTRSSCTKWGSR